MEALLSFFSDLILFTAGIIVVILWLIIIGGMAIETYDLFRGRGKSTPEEEEVF